MYCTNLILHVYDPVSDQWIKPEGATLLGTQVNTFMPFLGNTNIRRDVYSPICINQLGRFRILVELDKYDGFCESSFIMPQAVADLNTPVVIRHSFLTASVNTTF